MIQDLVTGDGAKQLVVMQDSTIYDLNTQVNQKSNQVSVWQQKYSLCDSAIAEYSVLDSVNQKVIHNLNLKIEKHKRTRNVFRLFCAILLVGIAIK